MSQFLKFTDPDDGTPVYVRAESVLAVYEQPAKKTPPFGLHEGVTVAGTGHTVIRVGDGNVRVAEVPPVVIADLIRNGR